MDGRQHRRYRGLVQPSFVPAKAQWWIRNWIEEAVHAVIDGFVDDGRAELNVDFCAAIPVLTITGSFGVPVEQALDIRAALRNPADVVAMIAPIVAARREAPEDDLISVLVQSELTDEDGVTHQLTDAEIYSFSLLLLTAGSGTTYIAADRDFATGASYAPMAQPSVSSRRILHACTTADERSP